MSDTPILFVIFNRPEHTRQVLSVLQEIKPTKLYVAADGPRPGNDSDLRKCEMTRNLIDEYVDWPCELKKLFRDHNVGAGLGVSEAITWFLDEEGQGIILEDDCVPSHSFFDYCATLLDKYKDDNRVMHIAGANHIPSLTRNTENSYFFSMQGNMWGWATWKRAWDLYDFQMSSFQQVLDENILASFIPDALVRNYVVKKFKDTMSHRNDAWDYQWDFCRYINSGLSIIPKVNLVKNVGFGADATHTFSQENYFSKLEAENLEMPLQHPSFTVRNRQIDNMHYKNLFKWILKRKVLSIANVKGYSNKG